MSLCNACVKFKTPVKQVAWLSVNSTIYVQWYENPQSISMWHWIKIHLLNIRISIDMKLYPGDINWEFHCLFLLPTYDHVSLTQSLHRFLTCGFFSLTLNSTLTMSLALVRMIQRFCCLKLEDVSSSYCSYYF